MLKPHDTVSARRLRFPIELFEDESIPGAIARGVREHVLVAVKPVLDAAGVELRQAGLAQLGTAQEIERLAYVIRCNPADLISRVGARVRETTGKTNVRARFGALTMQRAYLVLDRRRIGPVSLSKQGYHRLHWMNRQLPYCSESLERLVDQCPFCDALLGWRFARGIGNCDECGEIVPPEGSQLPEGFAEGYRRFAGLSSPDAYAIDRELRRLPDELQSVAPDVLSNLALQLGAITTGADAKYVSEQIVLSMSPEKLAATAATGVDFLQSFPFGLREWVCQRDEEFGTDTAAIADLRARFRVLRGRFAYPGISALIDYALPNVARYASHGLVTTKRYYLYTETRRLLAFDNEQMKRFKDSIVVERRHISAAAKRQLTQYDSDQIDSFAQILRRSEASSTAAARLQLPIYGLEQLCLAQHLHVETHPVQRIASAELHVRASDVDDLISAIRKISNGGPAPRGCLKLTHAMNRIGGGLKPWGSVIGAMIDGSFPFWMTNPEGDIGDVLVLANDLASYRHMPVELGKLPGGPEQFISQRDAAEILNIAARYLVDLADDLGMAFERRGRRLTASRTSVLHTARRVAWPGEIGLHLGVASQSVRNVMLSKKVTAISTGWDRCQLRDAGILPQ